MQLTVKIDLGNESMQTLFDAKHAICFSFDQYGSRRDGTRAILKGGESAPVTDENGNIVGHWEVTDEDAARASVADQIKHEAKRRR